MKSRRYVLEIAIRMESAFIRRTRRQDSRWSPTAKSWLRLARRLIALNESNAIFPLDPELFIVVQNDSTLMNLDLPEAENEAITHFSDKIKHMIRKLQAEISEELRWLEHSSDRGVGMDQLILSPSRKLTPLSRYIHACRNNRAELAGLLLADVIRQHESCPLYRHACQKWLAGQRYPTPTSLDRWRSPVGTPLPYWDVSHN